MAVVFSASISKAFWSISSLSINKAVAPVADPFSISTPRLDSNFVNVVDAIFIPPVVSISNAPASISTTLFVAASASKWKTVPFILAGVIVTLPSTVNVKSAASASSSTVVNVVAPWVVVAIEK